MAPDGPDRVGGWRDRLRAVRERIEERMRRTRGTGPRAEAAPPGGPPRRRRARRALAAAVVLVLLLLLLAGAVMIANYGFPDFSTPGTVQRVEVPGTVYVDAILRIHEEGMRPWLPNDRIWPTILLDNPQAFQQGELEAVRYAVRVLRDSLSRQRSTDAIDADVEEAYNALAISETSWIFPRAEGEYARAMRALRRYRARLVAGEAHFYPRADNLVELIQQFNSLTGGANTRLYNCVRDLRPRISEEKIDDPYLGGESIVRTSVPWSETDDHFYYARGVAFVYREIMLAVLAEFAEVLRIRNGDELAASIVRDFLDYAQFEPIYVANGRYGSPWANHPYQLLGLLSQVRERSRSLITMLNVDVR